MMNKKPNPAINEIYDILEDYEWRIDVYEYGVVNAIRDYLDNHTNIPYEIGCSDWPNENGGECAIALMENNHPYLVMFTYIYSGGMID